MVISPLLSLIQDQVKPCQQKSDAATIAKSLCSTVMRTFHCQRVPLCGHNSLLATEASLRDWWNFVW